jgi:hypothetical protein
MPNVGGLFGNKRAIAGKQYADGRIAANEDCIAHRELQLTRFNQNGMTLPGIRNGKGHGRYRLESQEDRTR